MFPLGMVVFPHQVVGLIVFEDRYKKLLEDIRDTHIFGTCLIERGSEVGGNDTRTMVGTVMEVLDAQDLPDGQTILRVAGVECFQIDRWLEDNLYPRAAVNERCCDTVMIDDQLLSSTESAVKALRNLRSEVVPDEPTSVNMALSDNPWVRSWQLCSMTPMPLLDQFKVLSLSNPNERLSLVLEICCERYGDYQRMLANDSTNGFSN